MWLPLGCKVTPDQIKAALELREYRDTELKLTNNWPVGRVDTRWHGDLGEIVFNDWLAWRGVSHQWFRNPLLGMPDFHIGPYAVELKTGQVYSKPQPTMMLYVREYHIDPPRGDYYVFNFYEPPRRIMWILGICTPQCYLENSQFVRIGEAFGDEGEVVKGDNKYIARNISFLTPIQYWLREEGLQEQVA